MGQKSASCSASLCKQRAERGRAVAVAVGLLCLCLLLVCERCLRCILSSGRILPSAGMDDRCDGGEVRPTRPPGKSGGKTPLLIYSGRRPNQCMQEFLGERCLEPGNPNRRSPEISDRPAAGCASPTRCIGIDIECGRGACREGDRRLSPWVKSSSSSKTTES